MPQSFSVEAVLSAVDKNFSKTLNGAGDSIDNIDKKVGKSGGGVMKFGAMFGVASQVAGKAVGVIGGGVRDMMGALSDSSATWQTFTGNMSNLGKSGAHIKSVKGELQDFAQATIYSASDMASTYSQLAAVGTKNTTQLVKGFGGLASAAEDPAQAMATLSQQATQMAALPKVQWADFKLMLQQTPAGMAAVAKTMHKSTSGLIKDIQAGKVKTQDFMDAIAKTGTNANFSKMATQYKTIGQATDGLTETLTNKLQPAYDRVSKVGISAISKLTDAIGAINFDKVVTNAMSFAKSVAEPFQMAVLNIKTQFDGLSKIDLSNLSQVFGGIGSVINKVWGILGGFSNMLVTGVISTLQSVGDGFKKAFSSKDIKKVFGEINGVLDDFGTVVSVVVGQVGSFLSSIDWAAIFNNVKSAISGVLGVLKPVAGLVAKAFMSKPVLAFGAGLAKVVNAALKSDAIKVMAAAVVGAIAAFKGMQAIQAASAAIKAFSASTKIATAVETAFNAVMNANPVTLIVTAIAALVAGLVYFFTQTKTGQKIWAAFVKFLQQAWEGLVKIAKATWDAVTKAFSGAAEGVKQGWNNVGTFFTGLWSGIKDGVSTAWQGITSALTGAWTAIQSAATSVFSALGSFFSGVWNGIVSVATALWNTFGASLTSIWTGIVNVASGVWNLLKTVVMAPILLIIDLVTGNFTQLQADLTLIWNSITSAAGQIWDGLKTYFSGVIDFIKTYFVSAWNALSSFLSSLWSGIASTAKSIWNGVKSFFAGLWSAIKSTAVSAWNGLKSGVVAIFNGIVNGAKSVFNGLKSFLSGLWSGVKSAAVNAWNGIKSGIVSAAKAVINGVKTAWNAFKSLPSTVIGWIRGGFKALANIDLGAAGRAIMNSFLSGLKGVWKGVQDFVGGIGDWIRKHKGPISYDKKLLIPAGNAIMNGLNAGLSDRFKIVRKNVSGMAGALADSFNPHALSTALAGINGQLNSGLNASVAQDLDLSNHMTIEVPVLVDGKQVAKATAKPMMAEQQRLTKMTNRLNGHV